MTLKWPWTVIMRSVALHTCVSEPTTKICMKIGPYYQRRKCSPGIAVSSKKGLCGYSQGLAGEGLHIGSSKWRFSLILPAISSEPSHLMPQPPQLLYYMLCSPIVALRWHRNRWHWMTLNHHFVLKCVWGSATNELAFLAFGQNCWKIKSYLYTVRDKIVAHGS